jgi:hypothetical protein
VDSSLGPYYNRTLPRTGSVRFFAKPRFSTL